MLPQAGLDKEMRYTIHDSEINGYFMIKPYLRCSILLWRMQLRFPERSTGIGHLTAAVLVVLAKRISNVQVCFRHLLPKVFEYSTRN
jgi:hypothetical protein